MGKLGAQEGDVLGGDAFTGEQQGDARWIGHHLLAADSALRFGQRHGDRRGAERLTRGQGHGRDGRQIDGVWAGRG